MEFSVVVLTYCRPGRLRLLLEHLRGVRGVVEVIVVDNATEGPEILQVAQDFSWCKFIRLPENVGTGGRNAGLQVATGDCVITLDDDVVGITPADLDTLREKFQSSPDLGALCFQVIDEQTRQVCNWVHHCKPEDYSGREFDTYEITEGAVAFRREALAQSGMYTEYFFISHEGPDLALRLMGAGYRVSYSPRVQVVHAHAEEGRPSWRRYYYDTRNTLWLAARNFPLHYWGRRVLLPLCAMLIYAARDGFVRYWFKGVRDALRRMPRVWAERQVLSPAVRARVAEIDALRPPLIYLLRKRLFSSGVKI